MTQRTCFRSRTEDSRDEKGKDDYHRDLLATFTEYAECSSSIRVETLGAFETERALLRRHARFSASLRATLASAGIRTLVDIQR